MKAQEKIKLIKKELKSQDINFFEVKKNESYLDQYIVICVRNLSTQQIKILCKKFENFKVIIKNQIDPKILEYCQSRLASIHSESFKKIGVKPFFSLAQVNKFAQDLIGLKNKYKINY